MHAPPVADSPPAVAAGSPTTATSGPEPASSLGPRGSGGTLGRLVRFALANVRRRPERFVLSTLGIALAVMAVVVVRTISAAFGAAGSTSLAAVLTDDPVWVVPAAGVTYDPQLQAFLAQGPAPDLTAPDGWEVAETLTTRWDSPAGPIALYGRDGAGGAGSAGDTAPAGSALVGSAAAEQLGTTDGATIDIAGSALTVRVSGGGHEVVVPADVARAAGATDGWLTLAPPADQAGAQDLGDRLGAATGLPATTDPSTVPDPAGEGLIYDTVGGSSALTFSQRFSAIFSGAVTGSTLGLVSTAGLVLGFVIAVSSFLAGVAERRREFGIMSSIGLADEVLYFFLVESALVFATAWLSGSLLAGAAVALVVPGVATVGAWLAASGTVAAYLPAMAIVGALVPVHRLLQQRPVALLSD